MGKKAFKWIKITSKNLPEAKKELWLWWHGCLIYGSLNIPEDKRLKPYWSNSEGETATLNSGVVTHYAEIYEP